MEGLKRNLYSLKNFVDLTSPDLIFLSEPQIFTSDVSHCMTPFRGEYSSELNSEEKRDQVFAMTKSKATGGTMVLWKKSLDKHIVVYPVSSPSFLPIVYSPPGSPVSVHIALYLPTSGREADFIDAITQLTITIEDITSKYDDCLIFLRGDANINPNNHDRMLILSSFLSKHSLVQVPIGHKTYHHFLGGGAFDSEIDIIIHTKNESVFETITKIFCKHVHPEIDSHHDIILSSVSIPLADFPLPPQDLVSAPRSGLTRHKILWSEEGIAMYQQEVAEKLSECRLRWLNPLSKTSMSILLATTNDILSRAARTTNKYIDLSINKSVKSRRKPKEVKISETILKNVYNYNKNHPSSTQTLKAARNKHRSLIRSLRNKDYMDQDEKLFSIGTSNPTAAFNLIKSAKSSGSVQVPYIKVGNKRYDGDRVVDGLYESICNLKSLDSKHLESSPYHASLLQDYKNIKYLCANKFDLPQISLEKSSAILKRIKPDVNDLFSITANHFIHAGSAGFVHFNLLLNGFILDVNNCTVEELNSVYALLLYKGHKKDRTLDTSYRTISTCPLIAKGLDIYVRDLSIDKWNEKQAVTQYQGEGSSHELASLLVTEAIQHSKFKSKKPVFLLLLDAKSAFDAVIVPYLVRNLYMSGMEGHSVLYMENRLANRITFLDFDKILVGPVYDQKGLEQGGVSSSDCYKIYNNELFDLAQTSNLGVDLGGNLVISAVGQADDAALLANDLSKLYHILQIALNYCAKFNVQLCPSKTKLLVISPPRINTFVPYNPITIDDKNIQFVEEAEHVGVLRSTHGNMPNIILRISSFKGALGSVVSCGLARGSRSNSSASLRILTLYATPVLLSGLASLVLTSKEINCVDQQFKRTLQNILKISANSPPALVYFIAGSLPGKAILHKKQLTLFGMICRLRDDPLNKHARQVLLTSSSPTSWFIQVRDLFLQYQLPHPLQLLDNPLTKEQFKRLLKAKVVDYWETALRNEASSLLSLDYFKPQYMSLSSPHKLLTSAGPKSYEVTKARIQLLFLSSQYPSAKLQRHWSLENPLGLCTFQYCQDRLIVESPEHILLHCPAYSASRQNMVSLCLKVEDSVSHSLVIGLLVSNSNQKMMQFLLDCSVMPDVIYWAQHHGDHILNDLFYLSRTWCFAIHRERMKRLGRWHFK